jgi:glycosyltransferase involved in cell wall biosynthesis
MVAQLLNSEACRNRRLWSPVSLQHMVVCGDTLATRPRGADPQLSSLGSSTVTPAIPAGRPIRVLAFMEATTITGPAKNLIEFAIRARRPSPGLPSVELSVATFLRPGSGDGNLFIRTVKQAELEADIIHERFRFDPAVIPQLRRLVRTRQPDIIQTHNFKSHFLVRLTGTGRYCRWIAFHHGHTSIDLKNVAYNQLDRWSLLAADRIVTVCDQFARDLERIGVPAEKIKVQHNAVKPFVPSSTDEVNRVRSALGIPVDSLVLLVAGRLSGEKGHVDLIDAVARLGSNSPQKRFRLLIAGDGPERECIQQRIKRLGVAAFVTLLGFQGDLRPYYTMADMMILPSHSEGSPNVLLEAMAAGLPVLATAVGGVPDIVQDSQTALLVGQGDATAMADAIGRLLDDVGLRRILGAAARQAALQFDPETYYASLVQTYARELA